MSKDDDYAPDSSAALGPMLLYRSGDNERAVMLGRGLKLESYTDDKGVAKVSVTVGTYGKEYSYFTVEGDAAAMTPDDGGSLFDKIRLRFNAAARNDTDVDLRFCTGTVATRDPKQDNLYGLGDKGASFAPR